MSLAEALANAAEYVANKPRCTVCQLLATLDDNDKAALINAINNPAIQATAIARALDSEGHPLTGNTIARHRRGDCRGNR